MHHALSSYDPTQEGIYSIVRDTDGQLKEVFYYQVNFIDGRTKYITPDQKERLLPLLGNPDTKFITLDGEAFAVHQITSITKEKEGIYYVIGHIKTLDSASAYALATAMQLPITYYLPKGDLYLD